MKRIKDSILSNAKIRVVLAVVLVGAAFGGGIVYAESYPGGVDNGKTSRIRQASDDLATLGYGSTSNDPDWGAHWNRLVTAGQWTPPGDLTPSDVRSGKTFYSGNRSEQTGALEAVGPCPTQGWHDSNGNANTTDNCVSTWPAASPAVTGDDRQDPVTGLVWSQCLRNVSGVVEFDPASCTTWSWGATAAANVAVGEKTAIEICSERGNGWRLPTQKELMQAYINGSNFNLTQPAAGHWSATEFSATVAWGVNLSVGGTNDNAKTNSSRVRCVR